MKKLLRLNFKFFLTVILLLYLPCNIPIHVFASDIFSNWQATNSLPYSLASTISYKSDANKIFLIGGATGSAIPANIYTTVNPTNGFTDSWQSIISNTPSIFWHSTIKNNNYIYLLGGATYPPSTSINTVYLGKMLNNESISSWDITSSLPKPLSQGAAAVIGDKLYFSGGFTQDPSQANNQVYVATISPLDGTLSSWTDAGTLPTPLSGHGMIAYNNNLYVMSGYDGSSDNKNVYHTAPVNGLITSWITDEPLPANAYRASYTVKDNYMFVIGGYNHADSTTNNQVYYSVIQSDGTLSPWITSTHPLPKTVCCGTAEVVGNYIYQMGGYNVIDGYLNDVYSSQITTETSLAVPILKQTDLAWKDILYDSANIWSPNDTSMGTWGCAVTSAAMVFQYNNITRLPENLELTPGSLNFWLESQPDGYVREGWVNWLALSRLSRLAKASGYNPDFSGDALEYSRLSGEDKTALTQNLTSNLPVILEEPGHFLVAKGTSGNTFAINDPYYDRNVLTDGYNDTFLSQGVFTPSRTDLSYLMIIGDNNLSFTIHSSSSSANSFLQQPMSNETNTNKKSGQPFSLLYFQKPDAGTYTIDVTSSTVSLYTLQLLSYDRNGEVKVLPISGVIDITTPQHITLMYDKVSTTTTVKRNITFDSTLTDIKNGNTAGLISKQITPGLTQLITTAQKLSRAKVTQKAAKELLTVFAATVKKWSGTAALSSKISPILLEDEAFLYSSL